MSGVWFKKYLTESATIANLFAGKMASICAINQKLITPENENSETRIDHRSAHDFYA